MVMISQYQLKEDESGSLHVHSYETNVCPVCGHSVFVFGTRKRKFINAAGEKLTLIIRRLRCKHCRKIHHELPDILVPYRRHCIDTVEKAISIIGDGLSDVCCENHTVNRIKAWWATCQPYFKSVLTSLQEKHGLEFSPNPAPREIIRAVVNANLWIHTRSVFLSF